MNKILWSGSVFHPTGFGKHSRGMVKSLLKKGIEVQSNDFYVPRPDLEKGLEKVNYPILKNIQEIKDTVTVINDYPIRWGDVGHGLKMAYLIHEGTKIPPEWIQFQRYVDIVLVPSTAIKKMAKFNGIQKPIYVVPEGVDPDFYYPNTHHKKNPISQNTHFGDGSGEAGGVLQSSPFTFLFLGAWTGGIDRKGAGLVIKAFHEEFKEENVELILKLSAFWMPKFDINQEIYKIIETEDKRIKFNDDPIPPEKIREFYWNSDCFVLPTMGEAFGLTIIEAMACFPYNTKVKLPSNPKRGHIREYNGELIKINTKSEEIECTPNHPILTNKGWKKAKDLNTTDLLYLWDANDGKRKTNKTKNLLEERRIGEITKSLSNFDKKRIDKNFSQSDICGNNSKSKKQKMGDKLQEKNKKGFLQTLSDKFNRTGKKLFGRNSGWRRNINYEDWKIKHSYYSDNFYNKHKKIFNRLDKQTMQGNNRNEKEKKRIRPTNNLVEKRVGNSSDFKGNLSIFDNKEKSLWNFDMVYRGKIKKTDWRKLHTKRKGLLKKNKNIKSERVVKISKRNYKGKVYNLSTENGIYFANNILVHNCGIPVIVTKDKNSGHMDFTKEYVNYIDWKDLIQGDRKFYCNGNMFALPDLESLKKQMRYVYENQKKCKEKAIESSEFVRKEFNWDKAAEKLLNVIKKVKER